MAPAAPSSAQDVVSGVCYSADDCSAVSSPAFAPHRKKHNRHHGTHPWEFVGNPVLARHCDDDATPYKALMDCCCAKFTFNGADALSDNCPSPDRTKVGGVDYARTCKPPDADRNCNPTYVERSNVFRAEGECSAQQVCCLHYELADADAPDACANADLTCFKPDLALAAI